MCRSSKTSAAARSSNRRPSKAWSTTDAGRGDSAQASTWSCFSGDKLFGGPQAGIIVGRRKMIEALKRAPLFRALRCDKLILAGLESTVDAYLRGDTRMPVLEMMHATQRRAPQRAPGGSSRRWRARGYASCGRWPRADRRRDAAALGAAIGDDRRESSDARRTGPGRRLREQPEPVIAYVGRGSVKLDLRTIFPHQDASVITR